MKIGLSSAAYYGQLETDEAAAHIAELPLDTCEVFLESAREYTTGFYLSDALQHEQFPRHVGTPAGHAV